MLQFSLRGNIFLYQGEELGLTQADVPFEKLQDPEALAKAKAQLEEATKEVAVWRAAESDGKTYYYHKVTKQRAWHIPGSEEAIAAKAVAATSGGGRPSQPGTSQ